MVNKFIKNVVFTGLSALILGGCVSSKIFEGELHPKAPLKANQETHEKVYSPQPEGNQQVILPSTPIEVEKPESSDDSSSFLGGVNDTLGNWGDSIGTGYEKAKCFTLWNCDKNDEITPALESQEKPLENLQSKLEAPESESKFGEVLGNLSDSLSNGLGYISNKAKLYSGFGDYEFDFKKVHESLNSSGDGYVTADNGTIYSIRFHKDPGFFDINISNKSRSIPNNTYKCEFDVVDASKMTVRSGHIYEDTKGQGNLESCLAVAKEIESSKLITTDKKTD